MAVNGFIQCSLFRSDEPKVRLAGRIRRLSESLAAAKVITKQFLLVPENEEAAAKVRLLLGDAEVPDPYYDDSQFEQVFELIEQGCIDFIKQYSS